MNDLRLFNYEDREVRTLVIDGEPWWVLKDVCDVLGINNSRMVAERLDEDELVSVKLTSGGQLREMQAVNESGIYAVILRSDKPEAKKFRKWVTASVLPAIRRTGSYGLGAEQLVQIITDTVTRCLQQLPCANAPCGLVKHNMPINVSLLGLYEPSGKPIIEADMEEAAFWEATLCDWRRFRSLFSSKSEADEAFIELYNEKYPHMSFTKSTLFRKWKIYKEQGKAALIDYRGKHGKHKRKVVVTVEIDDVDIDAHVEEILEDDHE